MFGLFRKKNPAAIVGHTSADLGLFHMAYERKNMPSPGIPAYGWETLGLVVFSAIGAGVAVREPRTTTNSASLYQKAIPLAGLPTVSGNLVGGPLVNPNSPGYAVSISGLGNNPFPKELMQAAGNAL